MGQLRVYVRPFNPAQTTVGVNFPDDYTEISEDVIEKSVKIKKYGWVNETEVNQQRMPSAKLKLYDSGRYDSNGSIFMGQRDLSLIRIAWISGQGGGNTCGFTVCGITTSPNTESVLFEGLINDSNTKINLKDQTIEFEVLDKLDALRRVNAFSLTALDWGSTNFVATALEHYFATSVQNHPVVNQVNLDVTATSINKIPLFYDSTPSVAPTFNRTGTFSKSVPDLADPSNTTEYPFLLVLPEINFPNNSLRPVTIIGYTEGDDRLLGQLTELATLRGNHLFTKGNVLYMQPHSVAQETLQNGLAPWFFSPIQESIDLPPPSNIPPDNLILSGENSSRPVNVIEVNELSVNRSKAFGGVEMDSGSFSFGAGNRVASTFSSQDILNRGLELTANEFILRSGISLHEFDAAIWLLLSEYYSPCIELKVTTYLTSDWANIGIGDLVGMQGLFYSGGSLGKVIFDASRAGGLPGPRPFRVLGYEFDVSKETVKLYLRESLDIVAI